MSIEITILSGSRQGERITLEADTLRVGSERACEIRFDPDRDPAILGHSATIQRTEDGWWIRNTGIGDVLVNHEPVFGNTRLRSGDVVRMSERGPDLCFAIGAAGEPPSVAPGAADKPPPEIEEVPAGLSALASPLDGADVVSGPPLAKITRPRRRAWPAAAVVLVAVASVLVVVLGGVWLYVNRGPAEPVAGDAAEPSGLALVPQAKPVETQPTPPVKPSMEPDESEASEGSTVPAVRPLPAKGQPEERPEEPKAAGGPGSPSAPAAVAGEAIDWAAVKRRLAASVYLLLVEQPDGRFSHAFATAFAVGRNTLLTSASVASHLQSDFRAKGFRVFARNEATGRRVEIVGFDVHKGWLVTPERLKRVYFDVGGLRTKDTLSERIELAGAKELARLGVGEPVACLGVAHDCDPIQGDEPDRFKRFAPSAYPGKILVLTQLEPDPASPRLLHVKGAMPRNLFGSPVVDARGRVVGVYAEAAAIPNEAGLELHYAPVLEPQLVRAYLEGKSQDVWVSAGTPTVLDQLPPPGKP